MNNTLKTLKSNFEYAESNYSDLRIAVINAMDELHQYRNGLVTDDSLVDTLTELVREINTHKNK